MIYESQLIEIKKSPLFNLSLASKELFHSNFLAWFFENHKTETLQFFQLKFPLFQLKELIKVERERKHIDIALCFNDGYNILIENKVKSLPLKSQLDSYNKKLNKNKEVLILLSLYPDEYRPFISYNEILNWIEEINTGLVQSEDENEKKIYYITKDYINFTRNLVKVSNLLIQNDTNFDFHSRSDLYKYFFSIRLHDIFHKIKYNGINNRVSEIIYKWLGEELNIQREDHFKLYSASSYFSRGTAASNFNIPINGSKEKRKYFEIQLQDNMLRFMLFSNNCVKIQKQINDVELFNGFFSMAERSYTVLKRPEMRNDFNKYGGYIIYKYLTVEDGCDLLELIQTLVKFIQETILNVNLKQKAIDQFLDNPEKVSDDLTWKKYISEFEKLEDVLEMTF